MSHLSPKGTALKELKANPAKGFFIDMLTRDISLEDAILDLLDNCVDGALRNITNPKAKKKFSGYHARIVLSTTSFSITDNCGGIPAAKLEYAFMHGRPPGKDDKGIATVGIYGIGMKRAIYKLGDEAIVATKCETLVCEVPFSKTWMSNDDWTLPLEGTKQQFQSDGTIVEVTSLRAEVKQAFGLGLRDFENRLRELIGEHYAYIIGDGFSVSINDKAVEGKPIDLSFQTIKTNQKTAVMQPYFWQIEIEGVSVFLAVGFYAEPPSKSDIDDELSEEENWNSDHSGWTVLCNHRVVAYCDKSFLTGWGDKPIPKFHPQFNAIRGIVVFESDDAALLPTTTTKRGLDTGKPLYAQVKNVMKDGLRLFIDSTNKWKGETKKSREMLRSPEIRQLGLEELRQEAGKLLVSNRGGAGGKISKPRLPEPLLPEKPIYIRYARMKEEIQAVALYLLGDEDSAPSEVGEKCFEQMLKKALK
jgi:hypothetical protein